MSAVMEAREPSAKYLSAIQPPLVQHFELMATAPSGVARLRELILTLAVQGKLVQQDPKDEPASDLVLRVSQLNAANSGKKPKAPTKELPSAPYDLPAHWTWAQVGELVEHMGSGWSPACDEGGRSDPTQWAVLRTTAVQTNHFWPHEHKVIPAKLSPRPEIEVKNGDILITRAGPMNRVGISCWVENTPPRLMLSDKIVRFHSVGDEMLPGFIVLALNAGWTKDQIELAKSGMAASQVNISQANLRGFWIPVCSKAEQSRIVTRVEELMRLCDALEAKGQLEAAQHAQLVQTLLGALTASATPDELADNWQRVATHFDLLLDRPEAIDALEQTILQLAVRGLLVPQDPKDEPASVLLQKIRVEKDRLIAEGKLKKDKLAEPLTKEDGPAWLPSSWGWMSLSELHPEFQNGASSRGDAGGTMVTVLRLADIKNRRVSLADTREIPIAARDIEKYQVSHGDILITRVNGSADIVGQFNLCDADYDAIYCDHFIRMRINGGWMDRMFLALLGESDLVRARIKDLFITTAGQKTVNQGHIGSLPLPLPPLAEQSRIVARVESLRRLCAHLRQRLAARQTTQAHLADALVESANI